MLVISQRFKDLAALYEKVVKHSDSLQHRYVLAKSYQRLNQWDKAEAQIESAVFL